MLSGAEVTIQSGCMRRNSWLDIDRDRDAFVGIWSLQDRTRGSQVSSVARKIALLWEK